MLGTKAVWGQLLPCFFLATCLTQTDIVKRSSLSVQEIWCVYSLLVTGEQLLMSSWHAREHSTNGSWWLTAEQNSGALKQSQPRRNWNIVGYQITRNRQRWCMIVQFVLSFYLTHGVHARRTSEAWLKLNYIRHWQFLYHGPLRTHFLATKVAEWAISERHVKSYKAI